MTEFADLAAILLAAGFSRRMGGENKLRKDFRGRPLIAHAVGTLAGLGLGQIVAVVGEAADGVAALLPGSARVVRNDRAAEGMGASLAVGAAALGPGLTGVFVVLADMPLVARSDYERLATAFASARGEAICVPAHQGRRGHPVLFPARHLPLLAACRGDTGARHILADPANAVIEAPGCSAGILADFDDPASFAADADQPPTQRPK